MIDITISNFDIERFGFYDDSGTYCGFGDIESILNDLKIWLQILL